MSWEFEHWDNGKVYLHNERWAEFREKVKKHGNGYPHNWNHKRILLQLHSPRDNLIDVPASGEKGLSHRIESYEEWTMIYQSYPAFVRTEHDPEGWLPSWHIYAEDNHKEGEAVCLLKTGSIYSTFDIFLLMPTPKNLFASFRDQFWNVTIIENIGIGPFEPPKPPKSKMKHRSIFDSFEESW